MPAILKKAPHPFRGTEVHTLSNGFKIYLKKDTTIPVVAVQIWADCGAVDEDPDIYGISHGLEHMVFKGTPTKSAGQISRIVESNGGIINAATQLETTHYYIDIPSYGLDAALDILADTVLHPTFPEDELEREKLVILEEIHRRDDSPDATLWDEFVSQIFHGTAYGTKVIGKKETVSALTQKKLFDFFHKNYLPSHLHFALAGNFDVKKTLRYLQDTFGKLENKKIDKPLPLDFSKNGKNGFNRLQRPVQMSYIAAGCRTQGLHGKDVVGLDILADAIGGGISSRFFQKLREEKQVALSISADYIGFKQKGIFGFFLETQPKNSDKALDELKHQIRRLESEPIDERELSRAKARIRSEWLHGSETYHGQASTLGSLGTSGRLDLVSNYLDEIEKASIEDIDRVFQSHLKNQDLSITLLEPRS
jgi:predicted Zn-dependent peptidase